MLVPVFPDMYWNESIGPTGWPKPASADPFWIFKNESMKFHEYRNHEYDIQDISVEPCVVKTDGTMTHNKKRVSPVLNGVKAKIVMPVMCIDLIAVDFIISTKEDEENLIQSKFSYIDLE